MPQAGLSGKLWPIHLKPKDDELLSSWLVRLATAHGQRVQTFCYAVWPGRNLWKQDTDFISDRAILQTLAEKTNTPFERTLNTTLTVYEGRLFTERTLNGIYTWILARQKMFGMQFCPWCLSEDADPYFRRRWRFAFTILCPEHCSLLIDRCLNCGAAVQLHRKIPSKERYNAQPIEHTQCRHCLYDLRDFATDKYRREVDLEEIGFQSFLTNVSEQGWVYIPNNGYIYSHLFFAGLFQIASKLAGNRRSRHIQESLVRHFGLKRFIDVSAKKNRNIRRFDIDERRGLLEVCCRLVEHWPNNFVEFCQSNSIFSAQLIHSEAYQPYWYFKAIREHLMNPTYAPSDEEFESVVKYLEVKNIEITFKELCKYLPAQAVYKGLKNNNLIGRSNIIERCPHCQKIAFQYREGYCPNGKITLRCKECKKYHQQELPKTSSLQIKKRPTLDKRVNRPVFLHGLYSSRYPAEVRQKAIDLYLEGNSISEVGRIMSIKRQTIQQWYKEYKEHGPFVRDDLF